MKWGNTTPMCAKHIFLKPVSDLILFSYPLTCDGRKYLILTLKNSFFPF